MPHRVTQEMPNFLMFVRELNLSDTLINGPHVELQTREQHAIELTERLASAHEKIRKYQAKVRLQND